MKQETFELHSQLFADSIVLGNFALSRLLVINDSQFPWFVLVPQRNNIQEVYQLKNSEQLELWSESKVLSQVIMKHFNGEKLNLAAIGNVVSQLHLHHVVRFKSDALWPKPIWGQLSMKPYATDELDVIREQLIPKLIKIGLKAE